MKKVLKTILFWTVQLTWGLVENLLGGLLFVVMVATKHTPYVFDKMVYFEAGENWGGFNCGFVAVVNKSPNAYLLSHEYGHFMQNFFYGPFMIFIQLASAIRYWYRRFLKKYNKVKYDSLPGYDLIWFENQANVLGRKYCSLKVRPLLKLRGRE